MTDVEIERRGAVLHLTIARPEARNSLTLPVLEGLRSGFAEAEKDDVRCVVLTGKGEHFCAGADLKKNFEDPDLLSRLESYMDQFHSVIHAIVNCSRPVIARVDGAAVGFGADLALACDLRVASSEAYLQEKFVQLGLMPDGGGTFWLPRLIGTARAMEAFLLGDKLDAATLERLGVVNRVVARADLDTTTNALADRIAKGPPLAYAAIRRLVYAAWGDVATALKREREEQLKLLRSADVMEGVMAWMQRREPSFQGR
ncbi:2-(1,2-epoxy-1,2-dihydrophenyl)acetyl-CoA isomerase PaaG [soil metagenome]